MRVFEHTKAVFLVLYFSSCGRIVGEHLSNAGELMSCEWRQERRIACSKGFVIQLDFVEGFVLFEGLGIGVGGRPAIQDILFHQLLSRARFFNCSVLVRWQCLYTARLTCIAHTLFSPV